MTWPEAIFYSVVVIVFFPVIVAVMAFLVMLIAGAGIWIWEKFQ